MSKRLFWAFIAGLLVCTAILASCGKNGGDVSGALSHTGAFSDASGEGSNSGFPSNPSEPEGSGDTSSTVVEDEIFEHATVVSAGKTYTTTVPPGEAYPDSYGTELTDGLFANAENASYSDTKLVGYSPGTESSCVIIVDLDEEIGRLYEFKVSYLCATVAGIAPPGAITVYTSSDNADWDYAGRCALAVYEANTMQIATLTLTHSLKARYVKFVVTKGSAWIFLDEVMAIADIYTDDAHENWLAGLNERYQDDQADFEEKNERIKSVSGAAADRSLYRENIARGAAYATGAKIDPVHPDINGASLTDGKISRYLEGQTWVGYEGGEAVEIVLTLQALRSDIAGFELYAYNNPVTGVSFPYFVDLSVSLDKKTWVDVGRVYAPDDNTAEVFTYTLEFQNTIKAKYVRFTLAETPCSYHYVEEIAVIAYVDKPKDSTLYPEIVIPESDTNDFWPSSEPDYSTLSNLIRGLTQQISCVTAPDETYWKNNTSIHSTLMTDGAYSSSADIHNGLFFKFNQGAHRDVIYDLKKQSALSSFKAGFTHYSDWAVYAPDYVSVFLSDDGKTWYNAGMIKMDISKDPGVARGTLELETPAVARFVCFAFDMGAWAGCDELEVWGVKKVDSSAARLSESGFEIKKMFMTDAYMAPDPELLGGVEDLYLAYHSTTVSRTGEDLLPAMAYLDKDGEIQDVMFDGFLFLISGNLPSGYGGHEGFTEKDGRWLLQTLFEENKNIGALDKTAAAIKSKLGLDDYTYKFYVTLYYPKAGSNFGDLDGDGVNDTLDSLEDRLAAVAWYMDLFEEELAKRGYQNIEFGGYYWHNESASAEKGDLALINGVSELTHARGSQLFWIPYYVASGYSMWAEYGFDAACMQPNYAFGLDRPIHQIINTAILTKRYGMGVEIEIDSKAFANDLYLERYMKYLEYGVYYGYIENCVHMYYMGTNDLNKACFSDIPKYRLIYDYTYDFIKGTLQITPSARDGIREDAPQNAPYSSTLNPEKDTVRQFQIFTSPSHGTVSINADGTFVYYPDRDYTGEDSFSYVYAEYLGFSAPCEISLQIG